MSRLARRGGAAAVVLAASSCGAAARAEPAKVHLEWPTVSGCPDAKSVAALVRRTAAKAAAGDTVLARAEVDPPAAPGEPWRVRIRTRTIRGAGERSLEADTCAELARASALLVALASTRVTGPAKGDELDEIAPPANNVPDTDIPSPAKPVGLPSRRTERSAATKTSDARVVVSAGLWASAGLLPSLAWGPSAAGRYELDPWSARLTVRAALPQDKLLGSLGATFDGVGGTFDVCRWLPFAHTEALTVEACAGLDLDAIRARGRGVETQDAVRGEVLAFLGLGAGWSPARRVRLGLDVRAGPALVRSSFGVESASEGKRTLHQPAAVRVSGVVACGVVF